MIIGIGNDIVRISRIERLLNRYGKRFEDRCFSIAEQEKAHSRAGAGRRVVSATYAKRFAAKEAFSKAIGTGIGSKLSFKDIEIINDKTGKPVVKLSESADKFLLEMTKGKIYNIHLSITDDGDFAWAMVVISADG